MQLKRVGSRLAAISAAVLLFMNPMSCAHERANTGPPESPSASALRSVLPHPAFAKSSGRGDVTIADIAERVTASVVNISATKVSTERGRLPFFNDPFFRHFFGPEFEAPRQRKEHGLGSGVIVSRDGIVLTNHHVIDKAEEIVVQTADKREFQVDVVGSDPKTDLAVLRLEGDTSGLKPLGFGDSSNLRLGDVVLAIGNPFGIGQTVTMGIVSAKGRANVGIVDYEDFIQTDAAINPGNSGGALVDMRGHLVGINTAIFSRSGGNQGIGFAVPSNMAKSVMDSLLEHGKVVRGWLGVTIQDVDQDLAKAMKLASAEGVLVSDVGDDSPAEKAGLKRGDVILSVNGEKTDSTGRLRNLIAAAGAGATVKLEFVRGGTQRAVKVELGELPGDTSAEARAAKGTLSGLVLEGLNAKHRTQYDIPSSIDQGVVVTSVANDGGSASRVLEQGDVILEVNRSAVSSPSEVEKAFEKSRGTVLLLVYRNGSTLFLTLSKD